MRPRRSGKWGKKTNRENSNNSFLLQMNEWVNGIKTSEANTKSWSTLHSYFHMVLKEQIHLWRQKILILLFQNGTSQETQSTSWGLQFPIWGCKAFHLWIQTLWPDYESSHPSFITYKLHDLTKLLSLSSVSSSVKWGS